MSFYQVLQLVKQKNHSLKQANFLIQEKKNESNAAKALYMPKIGITANYIYMEKDLHLDLTPVRDAITPLYESLSKYGNFSISGLPDNIATQTIRAKMLEGLNKVENGEWDKMIQEKQFGSINATFEWPLYVGGKIRAANHAAEIRYTEAKETEQQKQGEIMSELVERYFGLCLAKQAEKVRTDVCKGMQKHLNDAIKMQEQGLIANVDVLNVRVFNSQAERELNKSKRTSIVINESLLNTIAQEEKINIEPISMLFYLDSIESIDFFKKMAKLNNPLLKQVESKKQLAFQGIKVEKSDFFPAIAVTGMYDIANKDLSPYTPGWLVGIGMKWTLFDGASRFQKVKAATLRTEQVREYQEKANSDVETIIEKLYQELNMNKELLADLETAKAYATEYLKMREKGFREEMTNSTEVVDARLALSKILIERLEAIYKYDVCLSKLLEYAGISEKFISYQTSSKAKTETYQSEIK
jgi:outer membrane protein TolC